MSQYLQPIFHNVIIHEKAVSDIIFLSVDRLKTKVTVYVQRVIVVLMIAIYPHSFRLPRSR